MKDDELTGADVFGEPVPGEAVEIHIGNPTAGYTPRGRFARLLNGKPVRLDGPQGPPAPPKEFK